MLEITGMERKGGGTDEGWEVISKLTADGCYLARTTGSHRQFKHAPKPGTVTIAGKPSKDVPPGLLNSILKQAGLR